MRYTTKEIALTFGDFNVVLDKIADIDAVFNDFMLLNAAKPIKEEEIPYWAELWSSAIALAAEIAARNTEDWTDKSVLEIGCGLGLPSIVAGFKKAKVSMTDYVPAAVDFAKANWQKNHQQPVDAFVLDWNCPPIKLQADIVLAADVAYNEQLITSLLPALAQLCKPDGIVLLTEPNRNIAKPFLEQLKSAESPFYATIHTRIVQLHQMENLINVLELRKR